MDAYERILKDIKEVKIQGATNIAIWGIKAFLMRPYKKYAKEILSLRETEPLLQNSIRFLLKSKDKKKDARILINYIEKGKESVKLKTLMAVLVVLNIEVTIKSPLDKIRNTTG